MDAKEYQTPLDILLTEYNEDVLGIYRGLIQRLPAEEISTLETHLKAVSKALTELRLKYVNKLDDGPPVP